MLLAPPDDPGIPFIWCCVDDLKGEEGGDFFFLVVEVLDVEEDELVGDAAASPLSSGISSGFR